MRTGLFSKIANALGNVINPATEEKQDTQIANQEALIALASYKISDLDTASDPSYFGYLDKAGNWYVMKLTSSTGQARYCKGAEDYATNWTGRAALTYDLYNNIF